MEKISNKEYSEKVIGDKSTCVMYFTSEWCGPCEILNFQLEEIIKMFEHINFFECDIEKEKELKNKLKIQYIPTLVFIKDGKEISRRTGVIPDSQIKETIMTYLD